MVISNLNVLFYLIASFIFIKELIIFLKIYYEFSWNYNNDKDEFDELKGKKIEFGKIFFFIIKCIQK